MRGKDKLVRYMDDVTRITPAYAGKSVRATNDHGGGVGSPPRMRGKGLEQLEHRLGLRITPAYAGKSLHVRFDPALEAGSPPRMRGKD